MVKSRLLAGFLVGSLIASGAACSSDSPSRDRWATTENTNVHLDMDKVNEAYKSADGPQDLERRVNEIYGGDEVISVSVKDADAKTQVVTGFFDRNHSGAVDDGEKIFTIRRDIGDNGTGQVQTVGYGPYYGYHSGIFEIASGMLLGSMISRAFMPSYVPMYTAPYTTSVVRTSTLHADRSTYRQANPSRFSKPSRTTGRSYGGGAGKTGGGSRGGARFGLARSGRVVRPLRLEA